eukprot:g38372.t1
MPAARTHRAAAQVLSHDCPRATGVPLRTEKGQTKQRGKLQRVECGIRKGEKTRGTCARSEKEEGYFKGAPIQICFGWYSHLESEAPGRKSREGTTGPSWGFRPEVTVEEQQDDIAWLTVAGGAQVTDILSMRCDV